MALVDPNSPAGEGSRLTDRLLTPLVDADSPAGTRSRLPDRLLAPLADPDSLTAVARSRLPKLLTALALDSDPEAASMSDELSSSSRRLGLCLDGDLSFLPTERLSPPIRFLNRPSVPITGFGEAGGEAAHAPCGSTSFTSLFCNTK